MKRFFNRRFPNRVTFALVLLAAAFFSASTAISAVADPTTPDEKERFERSVALTADALVAAGSRDWQTVSKTLDELKPLMEGNPTLLSMWRRARDAVPPADDGANEAYRAVSDLARAVDRYASEGPSPTNAGAGTPDAENLRKRLVETLSDSIESSLAAARAGDIEGARQAFETFLKQWDKRENDVRRLDPQAYAALEMQISRTRVALNAAPSSAEQAAAALQKLREALERFRAGETFESGKRSFTIDDLIRLLNRSAQAASSGNLQTAGAAMDEFLAAWPAVEGDIMVRSPAAYNAVEADMVQTAAMVHSRTVETTEIVRLLTRMRETLEPLAQETSYSAFDAAATLLREGLEAMLMIAMLVALLRRSGNEHRQGWIWAGAFAGVGVSAAAAFMLAYAFSGIQTGTSREAVEGLAGLASVALMISVGAWLHNKSRLQNWNRFVERTAGASLSKRSLLSLFAAAFLAVGREGAETILFYLGMVPSIRMSDMVAGVAGGGIVLALIGYFFLKLSARMPIRLFFRCAVVLLYYLAFKIVGTSVHALQIAGWVPIAVDRRLPEWSVLGVYANWQTATAQLVVFAIFLWNFFIRGRRTMERSGEVPADAGRPARTS